MVDLLDHAVLVGGLDYWRYDSRKPVPALDEPRLREAVAARVRALGIKLAQGAPFRTGPAGEEDAAGPWNGIQVAEFPAWFVCQSCRALSHRKSLEEKSGKYRHQCSRTQVGRHCVPVRFVATCRDGHLEEFPWNWFVHPGGGTCDGNDLKLFEGTTGDFTEIVVYCDACRARRPLSEAREDLVLPTCHGRRPWLGRQADVQCKNKMHLLSRTASNAYFAQTVSALSIPEKGRELQKAVSSAKLWPLLQKAQTAADVATLRKMVDVVDSSLSAITNHPANDYSDQEIADAVLAVSRRVTTRHERVCAPRSSSSSSSQSPKSRASCRRRARTSSRANWSRKNRCSPSYAPSLPSEGPPIVPRSPSFGRVPTRARASLDTRASSSPSSSSKRVSTSPWRATASTKAPPSSTASTPRLRSVTSEFACSSTSASSTPASNNTSPAIVASPASAP